MKFATVKCFEKYIVVEGMGDFPIDCLRYDAGFPATEHDSHLIEKSELRRVAIKLRSVNNLAPTENKWKSYGWKVVGIFHEAYEATGCRDIFNNAKG